MLKALTEQAGKLWHTSNLYRVPGQESLSEKLVANTFADTCFFANSGTEAIELAIKMARRYHFASGHPERFHIITFEGAFHGRTYAAINAGGNEKYLEGFGPRMPGFVQLAAGDLEAVKKVDRARDRRHPDRADPGRKRRAHVRAGFPERLCAGCATNTVLLLIFDEIQTGLGRTGKFFAYDWFGTAPDIMTVAKALGGGFPVGAVLATAEAAKGMTVGTHGTTYGGNPLAMAVGNEAIDMILEPGFLDHVNKVANYLHQQLGALVAGHPAVFESVRGQGLMLGLKMKVAGATSSRWRARNGLIVLPAGDNVVRMLPPLTFPKPKPARASDCSNKTACLEDRRVQKAAAQ